MNYTVNPDVLRLLREFHGISCVDMSYKTGLREDEIKQIEHEGGEVDAGLLDEYAEAFDVSLKTLLALVSNPSHTGLRNDFFQYVRSKMVNLMYAIERAGKYEDDSNA